jgi:hypothetical protein
MAHQLREGVERHAFGDRMHAVAVAQALGALRGPRRKLIVLPVASIVHGTDFHSVNVAFGLKQNG